MNDPWDSRFAQKLEDALVHQINKQRIDLGDAKSIVRENASATGMLYALGVGEIKGMETARKFIGEIHDEMMGKTKGKRD